MGTVIRPSLSTSNKYFISKHRYYELKHFCLQYPEWKRNYLDLDGLPSRSSDLSEYKGGTTVSNPTVIYAEARIYYRDRIDMVDSVAKDAAGDLSDLMLRAVTEGISYDHISPPCCKEVWYTAYRRFFWLLDKARK